VKAGTNSRALKAVLIFAVLCIACAVSCGGGVDDGKAVLRRMVNAHGGGTKIDDVQNYIGRGFMKDIANRNVARSDPFDIYRKGPLFKNRIVKIRAGEPVSVGLTIYDGREGYQWQYGVGARPVSPWQFEIMRYLFPQVLKVVHDSEPPVELVTGEHEYGVERIRFTRDDNIVTIGVDDQTWLLKDVRITSVSDTAFSFSEDYRDYREVDGVQFPGRFTGQHRGRPYYEYFISVIEYGIDLPDSLFMVTADDTMAVARRDTAR
jgi:hypothetical protein